MELNDILKIGEVCEISGKKVRVGVYSEKNTEYLNYNGESLRNVGIGSFVLIRKGFLNIIGKVEGEYVKSISNSNNEDYCILGKNINRVIDVSILGALKRDQFINGLIELPLIGNYCFIIDRQTQNQIFVFKAEKTITVGKLIEYPEQKFELGMQSIFTSHIGIFGNTGSGKSNTLAKIFYTLFNNYKDNKVFQRNSKFVFIDFNGEYTNVFEDADCYELSTRDEEDFRNKYEIEKKNLWDIEFWSIVLEATDKTQKPFISRVISKFKKAQNDGFVLTKKDLVYLVYNAQENYNDLVHNIRTLYELMGLEDNYNGFSSNIRYNSKLRKFYILNEYYLAKSVDYDIGYTKLFSCIFGADDENENCVLYKSNSYEQFNFALNYVYCDEVSKGYIAPHHIGPLLARSSTKLNDLNNLFDVVNKKNQKNHIEVISLVKVDTMMKKLVPMLIAKILYNDKKRSRATFIKDTLHIIIDEAHNILSSESVRESEVWKDYRLELFEEIIKEGRKFGVFLTIASQRPSDISDTIISQLHNYFLHRLVNEEDLKKISKAVSFLDKASYEMIPILPAGGCVFSGIGTNFPILAQIELLDKTHRPHSENVDINVVWNKKYI